MQRGARRTHWRTPGVAATPPPIFFSFIRDCRQSPLRASAVYSQVPCGEIRPSHWKSSLAATIGGRRLVPFLGCESPYIGTFSFTPASGRVPRSERERLRRRSSWTGAFHSCSCQGVLISFCVQRQTNYFFHRGTPIQSVTKRVAALEKRLFENAPGNLRDNECENGSEDRDRGRARRGNFRAAPEDNRVACHVYDDVN